MEKLILSCGRYIPLAAGDSDTRIRAMEDYLARLSEEMETLLAETAVALATLKTAQRNGDVDSDREGGM